MIALAVLLMAFAVRAEADRPNILWLVAEDLSPNLGCYGDPNAYTPNLDALADEAVRYTRAFATAPACAPARSCLVTGIYATSLGTQHLRASQSLPAWLTGFPKAMREGGYYCFKQGKYDYNTSDQGRLARESWDARYPGRHNNTTAYWRKRPAGKPFFGVYNCVDTHQGPTASAPYAVFEKHFQSQLSPAEVHNPDDLVLPPYYPDTPQARKAWARYHDCVTLMDKRYVKPLMDELRRDGLLEDTIIFFFGDHGMGLPRGKRTLYDSGMQVPLLIYFPEKYQHLAPAEPGETVGRPVSFVDFAPTVLSLAGLATPDYMQGESFLGSEAGTERPVVYGAKDRVGEAFDLSRSIRDENYLYIRNYLPHLSWSQPETTPDRSELMREIKDLARSGELNAAQMAYAGPRRPLEELYDVREDPHQIRNLAGDPEHAERLAGMREASARWSLETLDTGFVPEQWFWDRKERSPYELMRSGEVDLKKVIQIASLVGTLMEEATVERLLEAVQDEDAVVRFWAARALRVGCSGERSFTDDVFLALLEDSSPDVRIEAARGLVQSGRTEIGLHALLEELDVHRPYSMLYAARQLERIGAGTEPIRPALRARMEKIQNGRGAPTKTETIWALRKACGENP